MNTPTNDPGTGTGSDHASLTWRLVLRDGRVVAVRPITPQDLPALRDAIEHTDAETLRLRFLGGRPPRDEASLHHLVEVDYSTRLALVAIDESCNGAGIARYEGSPGSDIAEVAVTVAPGWRRVGLGTGLLVLLSQAAIQHGIRQFTATYLAENQEVARLIARSGLPHTSTVSAGVVEVEIDLSETALTPHSLPGCISD
jgi:hypothetical protein